jgi:3-hydroxymyristoyl/3-hydroxydecanoyl-(acyl carrier protein) dehydratase
MQQIVIAPDAPYLRGHFPGRPIVPGVVELLLLVEHLSRDAGQLLTLRSIKFARFRQLMVPHDRLDITTRDAGDGYTRVDLKRAGVLVANAELELNPAPSDRSLPRSLPVEGPAVDAPPLDRLLPHRPPMRFVTAIERELTDGLQCAARISSECGLAFAGRAPALLGLEAAAQTAAAWEALRRSREPGGASARIGYVVAIRDAVLFSSSIPADESFSATVRLEAAALPLTHYAIEVALHGEVVVRGRIATVLTEDELP